MMKSVCLALLACVDSISAEAQTLPPWRMFWTERQNPRQLEVEIRWAAPIKTTGFAAKVGTQALPAKFTSFDESEPGKAAVLFLIDKSDPKRAATIEAAKALTLRLIDSTDARVQCAIYAFDSQLSQIADWGTPREDLPARLKPLKPTGLATELYRNVIESVKILERQPIQRRILVLLSDGKAEDTTYTLEQASNAAGAAFVTIYGIGYAETPQSKVYLQSVRRLAENLSGLFVAADVATKKVPQRFVDEFMPVLSSGGFATVDLKDVPGSEVVCEFLTDAVGSVTTTISLQKAAPPGEKRVEEMAGTVQQVVQQVAAMARQMAEVPGKVEEAAKKASLAAEAQAEEEQRKKTESEKQQRQRYWMAGGAVLVLLGLGAFFLNRRRQQTLVAAGNAPIFARLQLLDGDATEHLMRTTALRVGRGKDNDLTLGNDSVSRHHAEISRTRDGAFTITELNSGNGVLVNGEPIEKATLQNEDIIELGEVRIRFLIA